MSSWIVPGQYIFRIGRCEEAKVLSVKFNQYQGISHDVEIG